MLFNSIEFIIFFLLIYTLYLCLKYQWQNRMLLIASYIFYAAWDWRFLSLIWLSTIVDYICGQKIFQTTHPKKKKFILFVSIFSNLFILGFFKYFDFFSANLSSLFEHFGLSLSLPTLKIILPVGISFYTFQTMSYTIDIYYNKLKPKKGLLDFALFVAFFPQLVAGPIERAKNLLPQIQKPRKPTLAGFYEGSYLIFWGLFQKVFIADNLAKIVNPIFTPAENYQAIDVLIGVYAFAFQIFCDFAGYSNIARGLCKCMGFDIMINFNLPYFAKNPQEFWRRWHISLSTWLKDYLYIPLGGNRRCRLTTFRNLVITMLLGGLWHGASWTFILWGAYHSLLLIVHKCMVSLSPKASKTSPINSAIKIFFFFHITCLGWLIFRVESIAQLDAMIKGLLFNSPESILAATLFMMSKLLPYLSILIAIQIYQYLKNDLMIMYKSNIFLKTLFYIACSLLLIIWGVTDAQDFIYFQF